MSGFGAYKLGPLPSRLLALAQAMPVSWAGRRGALALRRLALLKKPAIVDAEVEGLRLRLHTQDNVSERKFLFMPQFFDPFERALLRERIGGGVFVDVGANAGIYSLTAAAGGAARVLAIEPNPAVLGRLLFNARANGFDIATEQAGVAEAAGTFDLVLDDSNLGGSSLSLARGARKIAVPCLPLADILDRHGITRVDALKIDIEGAEDRALVPFFNAAPPALFPRLLILEDSRGSWRLPLPAALEKAGYALLKRTRMNLVWQLNS